jgi:hypothetical protein
MKPKFKLVTERSTALFTAPVHHAEERSALLVHHAEERSALLVHHAEERSALLVHHPEYSCVAADDDTAGDEERNHEQS